MTTTDTIDLKRIYLIVRRHLNLAAIIIGGFFGLACLFVLFATPQYEATAQLLVDRSVTQTVSEISSVKRTGFEDQSLESEIEILRSYSVGKSAFTLLKGRGYFQDIGNSEEEVDEAVRKMSLHLRVTRLVDTYVFTITYSSEDPRKSADFANAYAEAYIQEQMSTLSDISTRTIRWLQKKINDINLEAAQTRRKLTDYRVTYNRRQREKTYPGNEAAEPETDAEGATSPENPTQNPADVSLREMNVLEQEVETYDTLYNFYLERLKTIGVQETFPLTEARVITAATPPPGRSHPKTLLILAASLIFGAGTSLLAALLCDSMDVSLRRAGQVRRELGTDFLGFLPAREDRQPQNLPLSTAAGLRCSVGLHTESVSSPSSLYSEVVRTIINSAERAAPSAPKVIGVLAAESWNSKCIVAGNLAAFLSLSGKTLLIDADLRRDLPAQAVQALPGLKDVLLGAVSPMDALLRQEQGKLALLATQARDLDTTLPYLTAARVQDIVAAYQKEFENIVIIMPDLLTPAEVHSFARAATGFVIATEWGKAVPNTLLFHLGQNNIPADKILGVVLENADMDKMEKFYGHKTPQS